MTNAAEYPARVREAFPKAKLSVQSFRDRTTLTLSVPVFPSFQKNSLLLM